MKCQFCGGRTRVVHTEQRRDGAHRWLRCHECDALQRTVETYLQVKVLPERDIKRLRTESAKGVSNFELMNRYSISYGYLQRILSWS